MVSHARRDFFKFGLGLAASAVPIFGFSSALANTSSRSVAFHNLHTGESLNTVYWEQGAYVRDALSEVNHVLRDFRTGDVHPIDPGLLDLLDSLSARLETRSPFHVISGYRSPQTNAMLHEHSNGVASKSLHMKGLAIDIRLADVDLARLHQAALDLRGGGVGYYPSSDFVHVDVGPVRHWG
jgi:uncharacterized protein YcbK (DUF882 family)